MGTMGKRERLTRELRMGRSLEEFIRAEYEPSQLIISHAGDYRGEDYRLRVVSKKFIGHDHCARATTLNKQLYKEGIPFIHPRFMELMTPRDQTYVFGVERGMRVSPNVKP